VARATWSGDASGIRAMTWPVAGSRMSSGAPSPETSASPISSCVFIRTSEPRDLPHLDLGAGRRSRFIDGAASIRPVRARSQPPAGHERRP